MPDLLTRIIGIAIHLIVIIALIMGGLKFLSFVVTGERRLFPKD